VEVVVVVRKIAYRIEPNGEAAFRRWTFIR
jgi:hypothetical protein